MGSILDLTKLLSTGQTHFVRVVSQTVLDNKGVVRILVWDLGWEPYTYVAHNFEVLDSKL